MCKALYLALLHYYIQFLVTYKVCINISVFKMDKWDQKGKLT